MPPKATDEEREKVQRQKVRRRKLIKALGTGGTVVLVSQWSKPIADSIVLPLHAQASPPPPPPPPSCETDLDGLWILAVTATGANESCGEIFDLDFLLGETILVPLLLDQNGTNLTGELEGDPGSGTITESGEFSFEVDNIEISEGEGPTFVFSVQLRGQADQCGETESVSGTFAIEVFETPCDVSGTFTMTRGEIEELLSASRSSASRRTWRR